MSDKSQKKNVSQRKMQTVPIGLERLLAMAAVDERFADALISDREKAIASSGVDLTGAEKGIILSASDDALRQMIGSITGRIPTRERRHFLRKSAAALLALVGGGILTSAGLGGCDKSTSPDIPITGILSGDHFQAGSHTVLFDLINSYRLEESLDALYVGPSNRKVAQYYADIIADPENETNPPEYRNDLVPGFPDTLLEEYGVIFTIAGETGAVDYTNEMITEEDAFNRLSKDVLLNQVFTKIGVGSRRFKCSSGESTNAWVVVLSD